MKHLNHHRTLTVKDPLKRMSKSTNFDDITQTPTHHSRINTCSNINRSILRMQSSPANGLFSRNDSVKQNIKPLSKMKTKQNPFISNLFTNIIKHRHTHSKTLTTEKQKQRFIQRFSQTLSQDSFKVTGFQLDHHSLGYVFDYIGQIKNIKHIVLDCNPLGIEGMKKLANLVSHADIRELSLVSVGLHNKEASILFQSLAVKATIRKLNVSSIEGILKNKITSEGVQNLNKLLVSPYCELEILRMDYVLLGNEGLKTLFSNIKARSLQEISLSKNDISYKYMNLFLSNIAHLMINKLDLSKNSLFNEGLKIITEVLGPNYGRTPLSVNLSHLNISDNKMNSIAFEMFCREVYSNQTLESLLMDDNPLGEGDRFYNIKFYIHKNWRLKQLSLANISCNDKDLRCICEGIESNRSLQYLNLSRNEIDNETLYTLFNTLTRNRFLRKIQLDSCKISDTSLLKIASLLTSNSMTRIEEISIENNYLGNKAAHLLKQMLLSNPNILKLLLSKNCIGERPLLEIKNVLKDNQRKRPFERQMHYFNSVIDLYDEKKRNLKEEVQELKQKEEHLKICALMDAINKKDQLKSIINHKIKIEKKSIVKLQRKLKPKTIDYLKEPSQSQSKQSSLYITEATPVCTMSSIRPEVEEHL